MSNPYDSGAVERLTELTIKSPGAFSRLLGKLIPIDFHRDLKEVLAELQETRLQLSRALDIGGRVLAREDDTKLDAARWRALLAACPDALGSAGLDWNEDGTVSLKVDDDGYIHTGICNFHTQASLAYFEKTSIARGRNILIAIADQVIKQGGEAWAFVNGKRIKVTKAVDA